MSKIPIFNGIAAKIAHFQGVLLVAFQRPHEKTQNSGQKLKVSAKSKTRFAEHRSKKRLH